MPTIGAMAWSSVGKKLITGITGLGLVGFVITHLIGNLTLLIGAEAFNEYTYFLHHLGHGWFVILAEMGLIGFFLLHIVSGLRVAMSRRLGRPKGYVVRGDAGSPSRKTAASRSMAISGIFLLVFVVLHVRHFKFGPEYTTLVHGEPSRDLYRLVVAEFQEPLVVGAYVLSMLFLGLHLRHGVWSMIQSLGGLSRKLLPLAYTAALFVGALLALGFIILPLYIYFFVDPAASAAAIGGMR